MRLRLYFSAFAIPKSISQKFYSQGLAYLTLFSINNQSEFLSLINQVLGPLLTSCDKPFSTALASAKPPEVRHLTFLFSPPNLLHKVTHIFWTLACLVALSTYTALISGFCSSGQDFVPHFLQFHLTMDSLCFPNGWRYVSPSRTFTS